MHLWRRDSAWNCGSVMIEMLEAIATSVHSWKEVCRPILVMDTCPAHTSRAVLKRARELDLPILFVPAKTTSCLQPLDVSCFNRFKSVFDSKLEALRLKGEPSTFDFFKLLVGFDSFFRDQDWSKAFESTVCESRDPDKVNRLLRALNLSPSCVQSRPTKSQMDVIWPGKHMTPEVFSLLFGNRQVMHAERVE